MKHVLLFTGHMIDTKDRKTPRFPAYKEKPVRQEIYKHVLEEKAKAKDGLQGIASGAAGGDILFHEICYELNIPSQVYLALPPEEFKKKSVSFAGELWDYRFNELMKNRTVHVLTETGEKTTDNIFEQTNKWMLDIALAAGGNNMTLLALWNGERGDGKGGTEDMVNIAKQKNGKIIIIDINKL